MATGVPDVITAANFFISIHNNLRNADKDFEGFASTAKKLGAHLQLLSQTLQGQKRRIDARGGTYEGDEYIWSIPAHILGDWQVLRDQTDAFMNKYKLYQQNKTTVKIKQSLWKITGDMGAEIKRLTMLLSFHIQKVQLVATALQIKFQNDMSDWQDEKHNELSAKIDVLLQQNAEASHLESQTSSADALREASVQWLDDKFAVKLQHNFGDDCMPPTLSKLVDLSVWWLVQGKTYVPRGSDSVAHIATFAQKFVYFSKAHWLLRKVAALEEYQQLNDSSIWSQYIGQLLEDVLRELENFHKDSFVGPSKQELQQLEQGELDIFNIDNSLSVGKFQSQLSPANASHLKILEISLPGYPPKEVDRIMTIYQNEDDEDQYTCEVITTTKKHSALNLLANVPSSSLISIPVSLKNGQIIPTYVYGTDQESTTLHLRPGEGNKQHGFDFNNLKDMFALQKNLTGHSVQADFAKVPAVKFRLSGIFPRTTEYQDVRVQFWLEILPKGRRSSASTFTSTSTSRSGHTPMSHTGPTRTLSFSSEKIMTVQMLSGVEAAHIFVFSKTESKQILWIVPIDHSTEVDKIKCCTRSRTDSQGNQLEQCCERVVIKGKIAAVKLIQQDLNKPLGIPLDRRFLHYFTTKNDSALQENHSLQWLAFDFESQSHKQLFMKKFDQLHALGITKLVEQRKEQRQYLGA